MQRSSLKTEVGKNIDRQKRKWEDNIKVNLNPLNAELNSMCHLLALGAHHILHVGRIRVNAFAGDKGWFIHSHNLAKFKSHMTFAGIRSSPYSLRWQDKG
jgi:hypothetical protein